MYPRGGRLGANGSSSFFKLILSTGTPVWGAVFCRSAANFTCFLKLFSTGRVHEGMGLCFHAHAQKQRQAATGLAMAPAGKLFFQFTTPAVHCTTHQLRSSKSKWLVRNNLKKIGVILHSIFFTALRAGVITSAMEHPTMAQVRSDGYSCL